MGGTKILLWILIEKNAPICIWFYYLVLIWEGFAEIFVMFHKVFINNLYVYVIGKNLIKISQQVLFFIEVPACSQTQITLFQFQLSPFVYEGRRNRKCLKCKVPLFFKLHIKITWRTNLYFKQCSKFEITTSHFENKCSLILPFFFHSPPYVLLIFVKSQSPDTV